MNKNLIMILLMSLTFSCGKDSDGRKTISIQSQEEDLLGYYKAVLRPINSYTSGWIPYGNAEIKIKDDNFQVTTYLDDDQNVTHLQSIHMGERCPTLADDMNGDGVIDYTEAEKVVGKVIIPLDGDISEQEAGDNEWPVGSSYTYKKKSSLNSLLSDLYTQDGVVTDNVIKLMPGTPFNLTEKVVLIHGTANSIKVPSSVQTHNGLERHISVPIVCGILRKKF